MKITISYFITLIVTCSSASAESKYNLSTDTFQLGQWSPKTLSLEQGLRKIKLMDDWFYGLPISERQKVLDDYVVNRNRLFIVTQEKRMSSELQPKFSDTAFGMDTGVKEVKREISRQRSTMQQVSGRILDDTEALKKGIFNSLDDISGALWEDMKGAGGANFGSAFSKSGSKSSMFGSAVSKVGRGDIDDLLQGGYLFDQFMAKIDCKGNKKCQAQKDKIKKGILERKKQSEVRRTVAREKAKQDAIVEGTNHACKKLESTFDNFKDFFDSSKNPKIAQFLKDTNIPQTLSTKTSNDLSSWYAEPYTQWPEDGGPPTATCVGHAIAANAMAALYKKNWVKIRAVNKPKDISPEHTYSAAKATEKNAEMKTKFSENPPGEVDQDYPKPDPSKNGYCDPKSYEVNPYEGIMSVTESIGAFKSIPLCSSSRTQTTKETYKVDKFSGVEFYHGDKRPSFEVVKAMIDSGNPPIVGVDSDSRIENAGWLKITPRGVFRHVLNVVGYDEGIDPMTLCPTKYFIVRDSLGKQKIHYKIAANNLLDHIDGIYQISKIHSESDISTRGQNAQPARSVR